MKSVAGLIVLFVFVFSSPVYSQLSDAGAIGSISLAKDFGRRWGVDLEQELRFNQSFVNFDRSLTALKIDYAIVPKILKAGLEYNFLYQQSKEIYEFRQRAAFNISATQKLQRFSVQLRSRFQSTWRDESRGDYKVNPKLLWRNKLECSYDIFGSPLKPSLSAELFTPLNDSKGFYLDTYRIKGGVNYRYSRTQSVELFVRYDQELQTTSPQSILYFGAGWNYKL